MCLTRRVYVCGTLCYVVSVLDSNEVRTLAAIIEGGTPSADALRQLEACLAPPTHTNRTTVTADGVAVVTEVCV